MSRREPADYARAVYESIEAALKAEGQEAMLTDVISELVALVRHGGPATADVTSAIELTEAQRTHILGELRGRYGQGLDVEFKVDPTVLGGLIVRVGDRVLDTTVRQRLNAIQRNMIAG